MKKKNKIRITIFALLFLSIGITFAYAASQKNTATNVVTVGKVSIELINIDDTEVVGGRTIAAGEKISKIVKVKNTGSYPAYVRMKIKKKWSTNSEKFDISKLSTDAIVLDCKSDWVEGTGEDSEYTYYYYQNILPAGATVDFMDKYYVAGEKIELLADYHESSISVNGQMTVQAEAVQSDYFDEQLIKMEGKINGWKDISFDGFIENTRTPIPVTAAAASGTAVQFVGNSGDFVSFEQGNSDLFLLTKGMLPGQETKQEVKIKNTSDEKMEVFLSVKLPENVSEEEVKEYKKLLKDMEIHIASEKNGTFFEGTLLEHATNGKQISLGEFLADDEDRITIYIKLLSHYKEPSCQAKVLWIFSNVAEEIVPDKPNVITTPPATKLPIVVPQATEEPTIEPSMSVTVVPEITEQPIETGAPTVEPEMTLIPTKEPLKNTEIPQVTDVPSKTPYVEVTLKPTIKPTPKITSSPTGIGLFASPEIIPSLEPTPTGSKVTHDKVAPKPDVPEERPTKTGDSTPIIFWIIIGVLSLVGCVVSIRNLWMMRE